MQGEIVDFWKTGKAHSYPSSAGFPAAVMPALSSLVPRRFGLRPGWKVGWECRCGRLAEVEGRWKAEVIMGGGTQKLPGLLLLPRPHSLPRNSNLNFKSISLPSFPAIVGYSRASLGLPARSCSPDSTHLADVAMSGSLRSALWMLILGSQLPTLLLPSIPARHLTVT